MASSEDLRTLDFFLGFFLRFFFWGRGAGFSSLSDESGMGGVFFGGAEVVFLGRGRGFWSLSDESGMGGVFFGGADG